MTVKVKPLKVSEQRALEKERKQKLRIKKAVELQTKQNDATQAELLKKEKAELAFSVNDYLNPVKSINEQIKSRSAGTNDDNMPFEQYFVKEIGSLDSTLTDILSSVQRMGVLRRSLNWDAIKNNYAENKRDEFEASLTKLETENKVYETNIISIVTTASEDLEALKLDPTRAKLNAFTLNASTTAFALFAEWNEDIIEQFHGINDLIDKLPEGEAQ